MKKAATISIISVFLGFIGLFLLLNILTPDREFSQQENRYLQALPSFSLKTLFDGDFTADFEKYTSDQFVWRDWWTSLKARCELATGKKENNGVYYCEEDTLITRFTAPEAEVLAENTSFINELVDNVPCPVYLALIPGAAEVQGDKLPQNAPTDSQQAVIKAVYGESRAENVDMLFPLTEHKDEYIFYRTDHHWTTLGAFYGYNTLRGAWELDKAELEGYDRATVTDSFYGTAYSSSGFSWVAPDEMEIFVPDDGSATVTNYSSSVPEITGLYDESRLNEKDKYAMFLGGNTPRVTIETGHSDKPSLCIIRDSYADCLLPFLLEDFSRIDLIDLRYYKSSLSQYINERQFDMVLVMYSVSNFCEDENLFLLGM